MAELLQSRRVMGKHKKDVNRLQLRREAIRILGGDSLAQVAGGMELGDGTISGTCWPVSRPPNTLTTR